MFATHAPSGCVRPRVRSGTFKAGVVGDPVARWSPTSVPRKANNGVCLVLFAVPWKG